MDGVNGATKKGVEKSPDYMHWKGKAEERKS